MIDYMRPVKNAIITGFLVISMLIACSDDTAETTHPASSETCAVTFDLAQADSSTMTGNPRQASALALDCSEIDTVSADVSTLEGIPLQIGGPWDCESGSGVIEDVPAGTRGRVVVLCKSPLGEVVYRGESIEIDLTPGGTVSAGTIEAENFVPDLLLPADTGTVTNGNVYFQWSEVKGAASYIVRVTADPDTNDPDSPYRFVATEPFYRTHEIVSGLSLYSWQVRVADAKGNLGLWSIERSFITDENAIPSAQITSPENNSNVSGNILFQCSPDMYDIYYDYEDTNNVEMAWRSSIDGVIGTSDSFSTSLTPGLHLITLSITDQDGAVGYARIAITVLNL